MEGAAHDAYEIRQHCRGNDQNELNENFGQIAIKEKRFIDKQMKDGNDVSTAHNDVEVDFESRFQSKRDANSNDNKENIQNRETTHQFWSIFRKLCSEFHGQINSLLLLPEHDGTTSYDVKEDAEKMDNGKVKAYYATSAKRNEGQSKLDLISEELRSLRRHVLSTSCSLLVEDGSVSNGNKVESNNSKNTDKTGKDAKSRKMSNQLLASILEMSIPRIQITTTDMRLITQELEKISKRLDYARDIICPKEKFVFKRYRLAMKALEESKGEEGVGVGEFDHGQSQRRPSTEKGEVPKEKSEIASKKSNLSKLYGGVLDNLSDCIVEILPDKTVLIDKKSREELMRCWDASGPSNAGKEIESLQTFQRKPPSQEDNIQKEQPTSLPTPPSSSSSPSTPTTSSYLVQNLTNVTLLLHPSNLSSLHFQNIQSSLILIARPIHGPVHATNIKNSEVRCSCYQLRVHDSKNVRFDVWVRSGPIIEGCTGMVFSDGWNQAKIGGVGSKGPNMYWDVKDFNWLRNLRKSPNFTVISTGRGGDEGKVSDSCNEKDSSGTTIEDKGALSQPPNDEEEDSDDEL